jgi:23S rRNA (guanosine2251-2'-O)-methyltransferase
MIIIAHDIRSLHNVGSILRNAAAFGVAKVYLTGITGTPPRKEIAKVALGAELLVPWEAGDIYSVLDALRQDGYRILALENTKEAVDITSVDSQEKDALLLGNEVEGIAPDLLARTDLAVIIPMAQKRSLNVSVASGVAMFALRS